MTSDAYWCILVASLSGGFMGMLVMWNRGRALTAGKNQARQLAVVVLGTLACGCALWGFNGAFGSRSPAFAAMLTIVVTGWAAILQPVATPLVPRSVFRVQSGETAILQAPWTGIRLFGAILRRTPLRRLGGRVFLAEAKHDPQAVLRGVWDTEVVHLAAMLFSAPWLVAWGIHGRWDLLTCSLVVHLPLNIYPTLHLRLVTWRLEHYVARSALPGSA